MAVETEAGEDYLYTTVDHSRKQSTENYPKVPPYAAAYERPVYKRPRSKRRIILVAALVVGIIIALIVIAGVAVYLTWPKNDAGPESNAQKSDRNQTGDQSTIPTVTEPKEMVLQMIAGEHYMSAGSMSLRCNITNPVPIEKVTISKLVGYKTEPRVTVHHPTPGSDGIISVKMGFPFLRCSYKGAYVCEVFTKSGERKLSNVDSLIVRSMPNQPTIQVPNEVIAGKPIEINCSAVIDNPDAEILWETKGPSDTVFYRVSSSIQNRTSIPEHCVEHVKSHLVYTPWTDSSGNDSAVKCRVINIKTPGVYEAVRELQVIPDTFCENKSLRYYAHPYGPCYLAVHCNNGVPSVEDKCPDRENDDVCYHENRYYNNCY